MQKRNKSPRFTQSRYQSLFCSAAHSRQHRRGRLLWLRRNAGTDVVVATQAEILRRRPKASLLRVGHGQLCCSTESFRLERRSVKGCLQCLAIVQGPLDPLMTLGRLRCLQCSSCPFHSAPASFSSSSFLSWPLPLTHHKNHQVRLISHMQISPSSYDPPLKLLCNEIVSTLRTIFLHPT